MDKIALTKFSEFLLSLCEKLVKIAAKSLYGGNSQNGNISEEDKKREIFSMMFMVSYNNTNSFRWFLTEEQKKWVLKELKKKLSPNNPISAETFFDTFINFEFSEGGMVSYFKKTGRETEYIVNFEDEGYIIGKGYEEDWKGQDETLKDMKEKLFSQIGDPFVFLEKIWAFQNVPFFYFDMGSIEDLQIRLYALLPLFFKEQGSLQGRITQFKKIEQIISYGKLFFESFTSLKENIHKDIKEIQSHALHSAVAAIMARNMSHNIGSHVLNSVSVTPQNLVEMQNLTKYVQQRMDFIAMITSEFPSWTFPARFVWDIMSWFYKQSLILDYIAEGEGLRAYDFTKNDNSQKNRLKVKVIILKKNGKEKPIDITDPGVGNFEDVWVAIPGGIIGFQAIYVILEGIIRNSAKHGWVQKKKNNLKNLEITIEVTDDPEKDYVTVFVGDNIEQEEINEEKAKSLLPPEEDKNEDKWPIHWKMNKKIIEPLIKTTGEIAPENWGIKELKIAAAFLQRNFNILQVSDESIFFKENGESFTGLIKAKAVPKQQDDNSYTFTFGYEFAIPKPKEVMIDGKLVEGKNG